MQASYNGDVNYAKTSASNAPLTQTVNPQPNVTISLGAGPNPSTVGQTVTLTANVSGNYGTPTGQVTFYDGGFQILNASLSNGSASVTTTSLAAGTHPLTASYGGDGTYAGSSSNIFTQTVSLVTTTTFLQAVPASTNPGQSVTLTATVSPAAATGTVFFLDGSVTLGSGQLNAGTATYSTSTLSSGSHSLTASYGGDNNNAPSVSPPLTETVKQSSTTSLKAAPASSTPGQSVVMTATVTPSSATGTVFFLDGASTIGSALLSAGTASLATSTLTNGSHSLTASYAGDANNAASVSPPFTEAVGLITTTTSLQVVPTSSAHGQNVVLTATVSPSSATGTVFFLDGATTVGSAPLSAGTASFSTSALSNGGHSLTASYVGDANDAPSVSPPVTETVGLITTTTSLQAVPASSTPGQNVVLTATVSPDAASGTVTFLDGATTIGSGPVNAGAASFSTSTLATGGHSLTASYSGDANDAPSVSPPVSASVGRLTTTTALAATPNPAVAGQSVTLTATVSPGNPTGTVSFFDGGNLLGANPLSNAVATLSTSTLSAGAHSLTATYSGDTNNAPSTPTAVNESVTSGSTTPAYTISTFAGSAVQGNIAGTSASLSAPLAIAADSAGNVFFADRNAVWRVDAATHLLTLAAGAGSADFNGPEGIAVDSAGDIYIADTSNHRIRKITNGIVATIAGNGAPGFGGDNGPAMNGQLSSPSGVSVDSAGDLYIADSGNHRIRKVTSCVITTIAGDGTAGFGGDDGPATSAQLNNPLGVAVSAAGDLYIADSDNYRIRKVTNGVIATVAGNGTAGFSGDGGTAVRAGLNFPADVSVDSAGNLYIADAFNNRIRTPKVSNRVIASVATQFSGPIGVAVDLAGKLYIADRDSGRIRKVAGGLITTLAGGSDLGDNGPPTSAQLNSPYGVAVDATR